MEQIIAGAVKMILDRISPEFRSKVIESIQDLEQKAAETVNPWDDIAILILKVIMGMK